METFIEFIKIFFYSVLEGITEWLPISSTGHLVIFENFIKMKQSEAFIDMFRVVVQLGAILAVVVISFKKLLPVKREETNNKLVLDHNKTYLWGSIIAATIPAVIAGIFIHYLDRDKVLDKYFYNPISISVALIVVGILFVIIEYRNKNKEPKILNAHDIDFLLAAIIGVFQILAMIFPGTSRSGITILAAMMLGASRTASTEYTFYLGIPVMFGASILKLKDFSFQNNTEIFMLLFGCLIAFITSILVIKILLKYIKKNNFIKFGIYRIVLGIIVLSLSFAGYLGTTK